jgi:hypothetical protein
MTPTAEHIGGSVCLGHGERQSHSVSALGPGGELSRVQTAMSCP